MLKKRLTALSEFVRNGEGSVGIMFALLLVPTLMMVGTAVDYARASNVRTKMQNSMDNAVLAAANSTNSSPADSAQEFFNANFKPTFGSSASANFSIGSNGGIVGSATANMPTAFARVMHINNIVVTATSTANASSQGTNNAAVCILALNPTSSDGLHVQGNNTLTAKDCWAWVDSNSNTAINGVGNANASARGFCTVGAVSDHNNYAPTPRSGCKAMADPYKSLAGPFYSGCDYNDQSIKNKTVTLNPGVYCGGLNIQANANVTFSPGTYVIKDGVFNIQANSSAKGNGVVFYFTGNNAQLNVIGGASLTLSAPSSGPFGGILFFQDKTSNPGSTALIQGGGDITMNGVLYMPTWVVEIGGNSNINQSANMFAMVADSFYMIGNANLYVAANSTAAGLPNILPTAPIGLVLSQ